RDVRALPEPDGRLRVEANVRPESQAIRRVDEPSHVRGRRLEAPVVDVEALARAHRARVEAMGKLPGEREATPRERKLLEWALEQTVRVHGVDRGAGRHVGGLARREHRNIAIGLRLIAVLDDDAERERTKRRRPHYLVYAEQETAARKS